MTLHAKKLIALKIKRILNNKFIIFGAAFIFVASPGVSMSPYKPLNWWFATSMNISQLMLWSSKVALSITQAGHLLLRII